MAVTYRASYVGIGKMLCAPWMVAEMRRRAERVKAEAERTAPVHSGTYRSSFRVEAGIRTYPDRRAFGRVVNDSGPAVVVEYGTGSIPAHATLRRALSAAGEENG